MVSEEDIEVFMEYISREYDLREINRSGILSDEKKFLINGLRNINNLLQEYKELKEFKKQVTEIENTNFIKYKNYIPKSLVEEKVEERKEQRRLLGFKAYLRREDMLNDDRAIACEISVLEELLKGDE